MVKECIHCNKEFTVYRKRRFETAKYCSNNCHNKARETHEVRPCVICGNKLKYYSSMKGSVGKYCSQKCSGLGRRAEGLKKSCQVCGEKFRISPSGSEKRKNCSMECYAKSMVGVPGNTILDDLTELELLERLKNNYEKYVIKNKEGCWGWSGSLAKKYPSILYKRKSMSIHRVSWLLHKGEDPGELFVLHHCDNPPCSAPTHLFLGTARDNVIDMHKKGRAVVLRGEKANGSKLTESKVREIKRDIENGLKLTEIAKKFNISLSSIYDIKDERTWKHVEQVITNA